MLIALALILSFVCGWLIHRHGQRWLVDILGLIVVAYLREDKGGEILAAFAFHEEHGVFPAHFEHEALDLFKKERARKKAQPKAGA